MSFRESYLQARFRDQKLKLVKMNGTEISALSTCGRNVSEMLQGFSVAVKMGAMYQGGLR